MRYLALACDYDGTIAHHGQVTASTREALWALQRAGRRLILVTGRQVDDLLDAFPETERFDAVVAENGAVYYDPRRHREILLCDPPDPAFIDALKSRGVEPIAVGRAVVATWHPHEQVVLDVILKFGLGLQIAFNKGAVMILPPGVNKRTGLRYALERLGLSAHNVVGIGDAENDHAFLSICEFSCAVANALESVQSRVDWVTQADHGAGVEELIEAMLVDDLRSRDRQVRRHDIAIGRDPAGRPVRLPPYGSRILVTGPSGSGKSTAVAGLLERLAGAGYQYCVIDPEGDYGTVAGTVTVGDETQRPPTHQVLQLLEKGENTVVNLLAVPVPDRAGLARHLLQRLREGTGHDGRPHWLLMDEAHHMYPAETPGEYHRFRRFGSEVLVTVHPENIDPAALEDINLVMAVGPGAARTLSSCSRILDRPITGRALATEDDRAIHLWFTRSTPPEVVRMTLDPPAASRRRHRRKYAEGNLGDRSFVFRGPERRLRLRAHNLTLFLQIADGVDDQTWEYHRLRGDYSAWIRGVVKDATLAAEIADLEQQPDLAPLDSRKRIRAAIERIYIA